MPQGIEKFGADEGRRIGALKNLELIISLDIHPSQAREILAKYWLDTDQN